MAIDRNFSTPRMYEPLILNIQGHFYGRKKARGQIFCFKIAIFYQILHKKWIGVHAKGLGRQSGRVGMAQK